MGNKKKQQAISQTKRLVFFGVCLFLLWQTEELQALTYPFTLLSTLYHELAHGYTAKIVGYSFEYLSIDFDGSGYALYTYNEELESKNTIQFKNAVISLAGLLSTPLLGAFFFFASTFSKEAMKAIISTHGSCIILLTLLWVRGSTFASALIPIIGVLFLMIGIKVTRVKPLQNTLQFLGIHACMTVFQDLDYVFMKTIEGKKKILSDTGSAAKLLGLSHEVVAWSVVGFSMVTLFISMYYVFWKSTRESDTILPLTL